jgi:hypothetical protein
MGAASLFKICDSFKCPATEEDGAQRILNKI